MLDAPRCERWRSNATWMSRTGRCLGLTVDALTVWDLLEYVCVFLLCTRVAWWAISIPGRSASAWRVAVYLAQASGLCLLPNVEAFVLHVPRLRAKSSAFKGSSDQQISRSALISGNFTRSSGNHQAFAASFRAKRGHQVGRCRDGECGLDGGFTGKQVTLFSYG